MIKVTPNAYFKYLLLHKSGRFAKDPRFRYFACNSILRWQALQKGQVCVQKNSEIANMNAVALKQALIDRPTLYRKVLCYNSSLRSTKSYWFARSKELQDMVKQLGAPTLFFTLSAADIQWPELYRLLDSDGNTISSTNEQIENRRRTKLLIDNPLIVAWFFKHRADSFIKDVLFKKFKVIDHWFRIEFQHRGSPHIHGFIWLEGAPSVDNLDSMSIQDYEIITQYFEKLISASNPISSSTVSSDLTINPCKMNYSDVNNHEMYKHFNQGTEIRTNMAKHLEDYKTIINSVQRHTRCTKNCLRKKRGTNEMICRYKFPKELVERSQIIRNESGKFEFQLKRNDARMNSHSPFVTCHWRANTDFQPIISLDSVVRYIAKYAAKGESSSDVLNEIRNTLNSIETENQTATSLIQRILIKQCGERDYSAQECVWIILGFSFYSSSRSFVVINMASDAFIPIEDSGEQLNERDIIITYSNRLNNFQISKQRGRPSLNSNLAHEQRTQIERQKVERMSMFEFFGSYYRRSKKSSWSKFVTKPVVRVFPDMNFRNDSSDANERFFELQVKLHVPWSNDFEQILNPNHLLWSQIYQNFKNIIPDYINFDEIGVEESEDEFEDQIVENNEHLHEWMIYTQMRPGQKIEEAILGLRELDFTYNWSRTFSTYQQPYSLRNFIRDHQTSHQVESDMNFPSVILSIEQKKVLSLVQSQIHFLKTGIKNQQFRQSVIIQGKAGSGKSTLIQSIKATLNQDFGFDSFIVMAPTGAAAVNVGAMTLHSALKINIDSSLRPLSMINLQNLQENFQNVWFVIIDEMSLLGCSLLKKVDLRLREAKSKPNVLFGGVFLYLLGDLKQLPPVKDRAFYADGFNTEYAALGQQLFRQIDSSIILPNSFRQLCDQQNFRDLLDRLADGQTSKEDWQLMMQRRLDKLINIEDFHNALRLFSKNKDVNDFNYKKLKDLQTPVFRIKSIDNCIAAYSANSLLADNLESVLYLSIGTRVMLRRNLWTSCGLVNGAIGIVTDIVVDPKEDTFPLCIMVQFDKYYGPTINGSVPIGPTEAKWIANGQDCKRMLFPLIVAFAITIHKSQGLTLDKVVVDIGENERNLGLAYVALSRVKTIEGLAFSKPYNFSRFTNIAKSRYLNMRKHEEARMLTLCF